MFDLVSLILDGIYGILLAVIGLMLLIGPYDKFKDAVPKAPSKAVIKVLGAVLALCGIAWFALTAMGIM